MSAFEFVTVLYSLVVAFGVSEILAAFARFLRARVREGTPLFAPLIAALVLLLQGLLQSLWGYWGYRDSTWSFGGFLIAILPLLLLSIATSVAIPDPGEANRDDSAAHYYGVAPLVYPLVAAWIVFGLVAELVLVTPSFHAGQGVRLIGVAVLIVLARIRSDAIHLGGLILLSLLSFAFAEFVTPSLN